VFGHRLTRIVTYARQSLVSLQDTPYYHCVARCVLNSISGLSLAFDRQSTAHRLTEIEDAVAEAMRNYFDDIHHVVEGGVIDIEAHSDIHLLLCETDNNLRELVHPSIPVQNWQSLVPAKRCM
jgi:hypothetical protein